MAFRQIIFRNTFLIIIFISILILSFSDLIAQDSSKVYKEKIEGSFKDSIEYKPRGMFNAGIGFINPFFGFEVEYFNYGLLNPFCFGVRGSTSVKTSAFKLIDIGKEDKYIDSEIGDAGISYQFSIGYQIYINRSIDNYEWQLESEITKVADKLTIKRKYYAIVGPTTYKTFFIFDFLSSSLFGKGWGNVIIYRDSINYLKEGTSLFFLPKLRFFKENNFTYTILEEMESRNYRGQSYHEAGIIFTPDFSKIGLNYEYFTAEDTHFYKKISAGLIFHLDVPDNNYRIASGGSKDFYGVVTFLFEVTIGFSTN